MGQRELRWTSKLIVIDPPYCISYSQLFQWPLDKRPPYYFNQSDRFADILEMLLRMRHIPPKATFRPDNGVLKAVDGSDEHAVRWFDMIQLTRKLRLMISLCPCIFA
jgi:hypothetical protein